MEEKTAGVKDTPLTAWHQAHGAKMSEFGGYRMPMEYAGIVREHHAVRRRAGVFDVSHMAEFLVEGPGSAAFLDYLVTNWPSRLNLGQALYTPMCYPDGGTVDDLLVYRLGPDRFMLVLNAANHDSDWDWLEAVNMTPAAAVVRDVSEETALLAVQGPQAQDLLQPLVDVPLAPLAPFTFQEGVQVAGVTALVSRTGYTGEDGFEIYVPPSGALTVWEAVLGRGAEPCGLGARDTLRLEARLPLYGHELSPSISPLEAGLHPFIKWDKPGDFLGRAALAQQREAGLTRRLAGLKVDGGIARAGYAVTRPEDPGQGVVTSGTYSPTLGVPIALALLPTPWTRVGTGVEVQIRQRRVPATVVRLPFYRREGQQG
jgi:aminomethyltransferase